MKTTSPGCFDGSSFVDPLLKRSPDQPNIHKRLHPARWMNTPNPSGRRSRRTRFIEIRDFEVAPNQKCGGGIWVETPVRWTMAGRAYETSSACAAWRGRCAAPMP